MMKQMMHTVRSRFSNSRLRCPQIRMGTEKARISKTALNVHGRRYLWSATASAASGCFYRPRQSGPPKLLRWRDEYLQNGFPACRAGARQKARCDISLDLNLIPRMCCWAATGSGKIRSLKLMLMQCLKQPNINVTDRRLQGGGFRR